MRFELQRGLSLLSLIVLFVGGCGDDHDYDDAGEPSVEEEGCEHMGAGPATALTAAADAAAEVPDATLEHARADIALVDLASQRGGVVAYRAAEAADHVFFLDQDVPFAVTLPDGTAVALEATEVGSEVCAEVGVQHTVPLEVGTYHLSFGPTDAAEVRMVVEVAGAHEHDHEE